jgi:hypothetical protein
MAKKRSDIPTYYNKHMINDYKIFKKSKRFSRAMLTVAPRAGVANGKTEIKRRRFSAMPRANHGDLAMGRQKGQRANTRRKYEQLL